MSKSLGLGIKANVLALDQDQDQDPIQILMVQWLMFINMHLCGIKSEFSSKTKELVCTADVLASQACWLLKSLKCI